MKCYTVSNIKLIMGLVFLLAGNMTTVSANAESVTIRRHLEGADLRVVVADGANEGFLVATNQAGCEGKYCPPLQMHLGPEVVVIDRLSGEEAPATYEQLQSWKVFYGEVSYTSGAVDGERVVTVIRINRPNDH